MAWYSKKKKKVRRAWNRAKSRRSGSRYTKYTGGWGLATDPGFYQLQHRFRRRGSWEGNYNQGLTDLEYHPAYQPAPGESYYSGYHSKQNRNERETKKSRRDPSSSPRGRKRWDTSYYWYRGKKIYRRGKKAYRKGKQYHTSYMNYVRNHPYNRK